jgi:uncharacterized protein YhbP (UPF0306 family)
MDKTVKDLHFELWCRNIFLVFEKKENVFLENKEHSTRSKQD